ncbi:MAG: YgjV family protein [Eubacteriales bacterium]|nr:YgjV family protein [Eubacteriales bacterium]
MEKYIIIQIIGFLGTGLFFFSYQFKENKKLFQVQFLSYLLYTLHFLLLGATTGGISYVINMIRSFCMAGKWRFGKSKKMCGMLCTLQIFTLVFTWAGWFSILPIVANIASTIGSYTNNARKIRMAGMFINSPLWIIYNIMVGSWVGILDEIVSEASMIISVVRFGWKDLENFPASAS